MKNHIAFQIVFIVLLFTECGHYSCCRSTTHVNSSDKEYEYIGQMIEKSRQVFEGTASEADVEQVVAFGRNTRFYPILRGWLLQEIENTKSQLHEVAHMEPGIAAHLKEKLVRLEQILRLIDLE